MDNFVYKIKNGPLSKIDLKKPITEGNCRLAIQHYFFINHGIYLEPEKVLCPELYKSTGTLLENNQNKNFFNDLNQGDIILAERIKNKKGESIDRTRAIYSNEDDWIIDLHSAIYLGKSENSIWHATAIDGGTCYWTIDRFLEYYKPVIAKRIL